MFNLNCFIMPKMPDLMPEHRADLPRTGHDLGHEYGFTATAAHLLPVFHTVMNPGEKITLGIDYKLRTMPLAQAAMTEIKVHTEYFFVPFNLLYEPLGAYLMAVNDNYSSNFSGRGSDGLPLLDMASVGAYVTQNRSTKPYSGFFDSLGSSASRLFEHLDLPVRISDNPNDSQGNPIALTGNFFPYQLLSYHAIYQYYYRLDTREEFYNGNFNWDKFYSYAGGTVPLSGPEITRLCALHYRAMKDDYFTSIKVSPIVDVLNINSSLNNASLRLAKNWLSRGNVGNLTILTSGSVGNSSNFDVSSSPDLSGAPSASNIQTQFGFSSYASNSTGKDAPNGNDINTANIRAMFANEKLWSITGRAKKHYDDQVLAHFGYKVPHDVKHEISCFGHDTSVIRIGEVISTASTSQAPLGEIAGKGYGMQENQRHSFTAPCHGCVMMIFSIEPEYRYYHGFGRWNQIVDYNDFYTPEFDHLGMQPMFVYEQVYDLSGVQNSIIGWEYRYEQFKRRPNKVSTAFASRRGTLNAWMLGKDPFQGRGANYPNSNSWQYFVYRPYDFNQIFLAQYSTDYPTQADPNISPCYQLYDNDPFVIDSYVYAKLISTMSSYSLPRLDA